MPTNDPTPELLARAFALPEPLRPEPEPSMEAVLSWDWGSGPPPHGDDLPAEAACDAGPLVKGGDNWRYEGDR